MFSFEYDNDRFRIGFEGEWGDWTTYRDIATFKIKDSLYIGVSDFFAGEIKSCTVYQLLEKPTLLTEMSVLQG